MTTPTKAAELPQALAERLRNACASVRTKNYPLSDLIPLMQKAADALSAAQAVAPAQPDALAYAVQALIDGKWCIQWPIASSQREAERNLLMYTKEDQKRMRVIPLVQPSPSPAPAVRWNDAAILSLLNLFGDGPYGEEDVLTMRRALGHYEGIRRDLEAASSAPAQPHYVQNSPEIKRVDGDVSKNGRESNMAAQPGQEGERDYPQLPDAALSSRSDPEYFGQVTFTYGPKDPMFWKQYYTADDMRAYVDADRAARAAPQPATADAVAMLSEVAACFTRDDDLPNDLLPRIDAALAAQREVKP